MLRKMVLQSFAQRSYISNDHAVDVKIINPLLNIVADLQLSPNEMRTTF